MMTLEQLKSEMKERGIVGAGGAGFPSYAKLDQKVKGLIVNCAECEPLLKVDQQLMEKKAYEILTTLDQLATLLDVSFIKIAIKHSYKKAVENVKSILQTLETRLPIDLAYLPEVYPAGDEVVVIYETTNQVVPPGKLPIDLGLVVLNTETVWNLYKALKHHENITEKYVTVAGEVNAPLTLKVPIGTSVDACVHMAGGTNLDNPIYIMGGPMTGRIVDRFAPITKTTNAILVLPHHHYVVRKKQPNIATQMKRAMSACAQCQMCTDLCPRHLLGHPIQPHAFMKVSTHQLTQEITPFMDTFYCSQCGLCEMYSCFQDLSPRTLIGECRERLKKQTIKPITNPKQMPVNKIRAYRGVPKERLLIRLGLAAYDKEALLQEQVIMPDVITLSMQQHIGVPAKPCVKKGDYVHKGMCVGKVDQDQLGVNIHASIDGIVMHVNEDYVIIRQHQDNV